MAHVSPLRSVALTKGNGRTPVRDFRVIRSADEKRRP
jgi:hypothetical protein